MVNDLRKRKVRILKATGNHSAFIPKNTCQFADNTGNESVEYHDRRYSGGAWYLKYKSSFFYVYNFLTHWCCDYLLGKIRYKMFFTISFLFLVKVYAFTNANRWFVWTILLLYIRLRRILRVGSQMRVLFKSQPERTKEYIKKKEEEKSA